ncbi:helix-turn-helix domain-containing protein [Yinghuangia sp. YIM S09857]|uniref:helix-turn-helix domain-containing protein n=1 Tax=Yinghuangia sp. YIM S09857 TaxID=3436929 RepID=UPI003F53C000
MEPAPDRDQRPPFAPEAARRARIGLHLTHDQVAYGLAAFRVNTTADAVAAWESGRSVPTEAELLALAEILWCAPVDLMGSAGALREHRIGRRLSVAELCARLGLPESRYLPMERANEWRGDERTTAALVRELGLSLRDLVGVAGASDAIDDLLHETLQGRPKSQLTTMTRLLGLRRSRVASALAGMHEEFAHRARVSLSWSDGVPGARPRSPTGGGGGPVVDPARMADRFWELLGHPAAEPGMIGIWYRDRHDTE